MQFHQVKILCIVLLLYACKENPSQQKKLLLTGELKKGDKFYLDITSESKTVVELAGKDIENSTSSLIGVKYEVISDSLGWKKIRLTYDKFKFTINDRNGERKYESRKGDAVFDPMDKALSMMVGSSIFVTINNRGEVTSVAGYSEIANRVIAELQIADPAVQNSYLQRLESMLGERMIREQIKDNFSLYGDSGRVIGEKWTETQQNIANSGMNATVEYQLTDVENNTATINSTAMIEAVDAPNGLAQTRNELEGEVEGVYKLDTRTSLLMEGSNIVSLKGFVHTLTSKTPVYIKVSRQYKMKRVI
jgi:hypothetical protein